MARDKHVHAVAAEVADQDAELLGEFADRARHDGRGDFAVAYAVLRFGQTVARLIVAMCQDDDERAVNATPDAPAAAASAPEGAAGRRRRRADAPTAR